MKQHSRFRFSARAGLAILFPGMEADFEMVDLGNSVSQFFIDRLNRCSALRPTSHIWLIANYDQ
jgi:hypothetical protein